MKTLEFTCDLKEIVARMQVDQLLNLVSRWFGTAPQQSQQPLSEQEKNQFSDLVFNSHAGYVALDGQEGTRKILEGLDIKDFYEPSRLRILVSSISGFTVVNQIRVFPELHAFYEKLRSLQKIESTCRTLLATGKVGELAPDEGIVQVELADYDGKGIEPERQQLLARTIRELHTNLARLLNIDQGLLRFKYFDSGSSTLLGILCKKELAKTISDLILQWWDKLRFYDFDTLEKKIEAVERATAMAEKLNQAVGAGAVEMETAKNLTRRIFQGVDTLMGIGVTPPLEAEATIDQKTLLLAKRDTKLLDIGDVPKAETESGDRVE